MAIQPEMEVKTDRPRGIFLLVALLFLLVLLVATVAANSGENALGPLLGS